MKNADKSVEETSGNLRVDECESRQSRMSA